MNPLISVIVPIFNVEQYLRKCVDSILAQTYANLEIILVDDGSVDRCGSICDEYAMNDKRITVIHKINGGLGFARNSGLEVCTGDYVMFVDSDDWLSVDAIRVLYDQLIMNGSDVAIGKFVEAYEDGSINESCWQISKNCLLTKDEIFSRLRADTENILPVAAWGKLYKRSIFNDLRYTSVCIAEDLFLFPYIIERCEKISISADIIYYYYQRPNSLVRQRSEKAKYTLADVTLHIAEYLYDHGYMESAKMWYSVAVGRMVVIKNEKERSNLMKIYFSDQSKRELLKDAPFRTRIKWFALQHPFLIKMRETYKSIKHRGE